MGIEEPPKSTTRFSRANPARTERTPHLEHNILKVIWPIDRLTLIEVIGSAGKRRSSAWGMTWLNQTREAY
jgi:hypothetical protein